MVGGKSAGNLIPAFVEVQPLHTAQNLSASGRALKTLGAILILAALILAIIAGRNREEIVDPTSFKEPEPEVNRRLSDTWPVPEGTTIWSKTNEYPFGVVEHSGDEKVYFKDPPDNVHEKEK